MTIYKKICICSGYFSKGYIVIDKNHNIIKIVYKKHICGK
jgi:hypothetical protein